MTAVGVTSYLLYLDEFVLSLISMVVFGKLIIFHFIMEYLTNIIQRKKSQKLLVKLNSFSINFVASL